MRLLYIFPHPDDESFGPAPAISYQRRQGDEVFLLTLTKGEATKQRFRLNVSKQRMGEIRYQEMQCVAEVLDLNDLTVWDFPDNALKEEDPIELEKAISEHINEIKPDVIITYPVHGISGFHDHLVTHAVVKRVFSSLQREDQMVPSRLAFFTLKEVGGDSQFDLNTSTEEEIDCILTTEDQDMQRFNEALDCYETYQEVIERSNVRNDIINKIHFEIFREEFDPPVNDLSVELDQ